jgi:hypothetical protein
MTKVTKQFYAAVNDKVFEMRAASAECKPKDVEMSEGDVVVIITMAMSRNGARGYYVPRIMWRENGKVVAAASLEII